MIRRTLFIIIVVVGVLSAGDPPNSYRHFVRFLALVVEVFAMLGGDDSGVQSRQNGASYTHPISPGVQPPQFLGSPTVKTTPPPVRSPANPAAPGDPSANALASPPLHVELEQTDQELDELAAAPQTPAVEARREQLRVRRSFLEAMRRMPR